MIDSFENEYRFLSTFYPSPFVDPTISVKSNENNTLHITWPSVENYFHAMKFTDNKLMLSFSEMTPAQSRINARKNKYDRNRWSSIEFDILTKALFLKFEQNQTLKLKLIETGEEEIMYKNWWGDTKYGVCNGEGDNILGCTLMNLRKFFKDSQI